VFAGDPRKRIDLIRFAAWLNQNRGILTVCHLMIGDLEELAPRLEQQTREDGDFLDAEGVTAFAESEVVPDFETGVLAVCQANGIAGLTSNTLMLGWSDKPERRLAAMRIVRGASCLGLSTILCRITSRRWSPSLRRIDVWWGGLQNNGDMLLLFAHLVSLNPGWSGIRIAVKSVTSSTLTYEQTERNLKELLQRSRINAEAIVFHRPEEGTIQDLIHRESRDADLVFLGLKEVERGEEEAYAERLERMVGDLPTVILVSAAGPFAGLLLGTGSDDRQTPEAEDEDDGGTAPAVADKR